MVADFKKYSSYFQDENTIFDAIKARQGGRAFGIYLRGWLSENKNVSIIDLAWDGSNESNCKWISRKVAGLKKCFVLFLGSNSNRDIVRK